MLISVATVILGGFLIICAAPFASHCLYKAGGGLFLISGEFILVVKEQEYRLQTYIPDIKIISSLPGSRFIYSNKNTLTGMFLET